MNDSSQFQQEYKLSILVAGYLNADLTADQEQELNRWRQASTANEDWFNAFCEERNVVQQLKKYQSVDKSSIWNKTKSKMQAMPVPAIKKVSLWPRIAAVAAILLVITAAGTWFLSTPPDTAEELKVVYANDIAPGKNTATLTVGKGLPIKLSDVKTGLVIGASTIKYNDGSPLAQQNIALSESAQSTEITVTTPAGGTYQIALPDGTNVWLNAASSLTYISGKNKGRYRKVKLEGEAYFEVFKDKKQAFLVESKGQEVEVLGTHFNISSYDNEAVIKTTLLEGAVKVSLSNHTGQNKVLSPNQQAQVSKDDIDVETVEASDAIAWKEGKFKFEKEEIGEIMRKVERWYNVQIVYEDDVEHVRFTGGISRYENVSKLLKMLESTGELHFKIAGNKITAMR